MASARSTGAEHASLALASVLAVLIVTLRAVSDGIVEMGDGVQHYLQARYCWAHPELLLDLWGKPLFLLLASPFAQLGHPGMAAFNAVVTIATCWTAARILRGAGRFAQLAFPLLLAAAPLYVLMAIGGMTEVLFGGLTLLVLRALMRERWTVAAVLVSLTPFSRPEYVAFLPAVIAWITLRKQWRALPWCFTGWVAYAAMAWRVFGDPLWFWTHGPYKSGASVYGSGDLLQFVHHAPGIFGVPVLVLFLTALLIWPWVQRKDVEHRQVHRLMGLTAAGPVLLAFVLHSYIWWKGIHASAGLARVLVTMVPLAAVFGLYTWGRLVALRPWSRFVGIAGGTALLTVLSYAGLLTLQGTLHGPLQRSGDQQALDDAGDALRNMWSPDDVVYSTHPYAAFRAGLDPFDGAHYRALWGLNGQLPADFFRPGELIFWDSQLGPNEARLPLDTLLNDPHFAVRGVWEPRLGHTVFGDRPYELFLFERKGSVRTMQVDTLVALDGRAWAQHVRLDTVACPVDVHRAWCFGEGEYPLHVERMALPEGVGTIYDEIVLRARIVRAPTPPGTFELVFKQAGGGRDLRYDQIDLSGDTLDLTFRVPPAASGVVQDLYLWNVAKAPFRLEDPLLLRRRWTQRDTVLTAPAIPDGSAAGGPR